MMLIGKRLLLLMQINLAAKAKRFLLGYYEKQLFIPIKGAQFY